MIETSKHVSLDCRLLIFKIEPKVLWPPEKISQNITANALGKPPIPPVYKQDTRKRKQTGNKCDVI